MDNVIEFRANQTAPRGRKPGLVDGAKVLIFTGVRYDRQWDDAQALAACGSSRGEARLMTQEESEIALDLAAY